MEQTSTNLLREIYDTIDDPAVNEHVSLYFYENPDMYKLENLTAPSEINRPEIRLTVDTKEDFQFVSNIYEEIINNTSDELSKNFENNIGYEKYKNMKLSYSLVFQNSSLLNYKMNYDYLDVKGKIVNKIIKGIRDSKEFKSLEKKFHESGLVLSFQSERLETPNYILVLSTSWKD